jgi:hypothetical protein
MNTSTRNSSAMQLAVTALFHEGSPVSAGRYPRAFGKAFDLFGRVVQDGVQQSCVQQNTDNDIVNTPPER